MVTTSRTTEAELRERLSKLPRVSLGNLPTPLEPLPRLSNSLGVQLFIKRDDLTGLAFGGNKVRHLEFSIGKALQEGCDVVINGAAVQSNYCRQTAAACAKVGIKCALVLRKDPRVEPLKTEPQGNLLLDYLLGTDVKFIEIDQDVETEKERLAEEYRAKGHKPFVIKHPDLAGGFGYLFCLLELVEQCRQLGIEPTHLVHSSSTPTQVGFVVGAKALGLNWHILGVSPSQRAVNAPKHIAELSNMVAKQLELPLSFTPDEIHFTLEFIGEGYGIPTKEGIETLLLVARTEGLLLEPIYTGKAFAAIVDMANKGQLTNEHTVIFVHTGGLPALFAYQPVLLQALGMQSQV